MKKPKVSLEAVKKRVPKTARGKAIAAATGVATAAAVGIVASRALKKNAHSQFRVVSSDAGWILKSSGPGDGTTFETKREAVDAARELAKANQPSHLIIENRDGEIHREHSYKA